MKKQDKYFFALKWYKKACNDIMEDYPEIKLFEDGIDADFYSNYRDEFGEF